MALYNFIYFFIYKLYILSREVSLWGKIKYNLKKSAFKYSLSKSELQHVNETKRETLKAFITGFCERIGFCERSF